MGGCPLFAYDESGTCKFVPANAFAILRIPWVLFYVLINISLISTGSGGVTFQYEIVVIQSEYSFVVFQILSPRLLWHFRKGMSIWRWKWTVTSQRSKCTDLLNHHSTSHFLLVLVVFVVFVEFAFLAEFVVLVVLVVFLLSSILPGPTLPFTVPFPSSSNR